MSGEEVETLPLPPRASQCEECNIIQDAGVDDGNARASPTVCPADLVGKPDALPRGWPSCIFQPSDSKKGRLFLGFMYYYRHPISRLFISISIIGLNILMLAEVSAGITKTIPTLIDTVSTTLDLSMRVFFFLLLLTCFLYFFLSFLACLLSSSSSQFCGSCLEILCVLLLLRWLLMDQFRHELASSCEHFISLCV